MRYRKTARGFAIEFVSGTSYMILGWKYPYGFRRNDSPRWRIA